MKDIFINLKRFDVPKEMGGICPTDKPSEWIKWIVDKSISLGLGKLAEAELHYLLPESLILTAVETLNCYSKQDRKSLNIGCQGVYREDVEESGNFGAFTTLLPAAAAKNMGCDWAIIGHSEERKDKLNIIKTYESGCDNSPALAIRASKVVNQLINQEILCALKRNLNVILCVGETAKERGEGSFGQQKPRIQAVLKEQLKAGLRGVKSILNDTRIVIGYEPIWAIGPGKTPPDAEYIDFVSTYIKKEMINEFEIEVPVVYGGGLKEENAKMISSIPSIDGGLVALTKFTTPIRFDPKDLKRIVDRYLKKE